MNYVGAHPLPRGGYSALVLLLTACGDSGAPNPPPPQVTVTAVTPATGPMAGGTAVTITGTNFTNVTSVTIAGSELGSRTVVSATQITGTTPGSSSAGPKDVVVTSSTHGSGTCSGCFSYAEEEPSALNFTALSLGNSHTCGLTAEGAVYCWGDNQSGLLGLGVTESPDRCLSGDTPCSTLPLPVSGGLSFASIGASALHTCGLTPAGAAYCWGSNAYAQLGIGTVVGPEGCANGVRPCSRVPLPVTGNLRFVSLSVSGGSNAHTCGLTPEGAAYCWGLNQSGELGIGTSDGPESCPADINSPPRPCSTVPVPVAGGLSFASLSLGYGHTCGLTANGAAYCWGPNGFDERTDRVSPEPLPGGLSFTMVRVAVSIGCGLTGAGDAYCWGFNRYGRLGDGSPEETIRPTPGLVAGGLKYSALSVGTSHVCGLTTTGAAFCWGAAGTLGDGTTITRYTPVPVAGGLAFSEVSAGDAHSCGLTAAGVAYCWGDNQFGQLGDGTTTTRLTPVPVSIE
jgi:alpha-tubulin suppressor-like RCC1 family protein